jgi:hypothetical protein
MTIEWIRFDPTFGGFLPADRVTPAAGEWQKHANSYGYTFAFYGYDMGVPVYAVRVSGKETFDGCDTLKYDYTVEAFVPPDSFDPLADYDSMAKVAEGTGTKTRIRLVQPPPTP